MTALRKLKNRVKELQSKNTELMTLAEHWSSKSTKLVKENASLRQQIISLKHEIKMSGCISFDEHEELISNLCR